MQLQQFVSFSPHLFDVLIHYLRHYVERLSLLKFRLVGSGVILRQELEVFSLLLLLNLLSQVFKLIQCFSMHLWLIKLCHLVRELLVEIADNLILALDKVGANWLGLLKFLEDMT